MQVVQSLLCDCGSPLHMQQGRGRPRTYCSDRCRKRGQRAKETGCDVTKIQKSDVTKIPDILFYCGLNEKTWNHHAMETGEYVCIAPVSGKTEETKTVNRVYVASDKVKHVLMDSSAFSDKIELSQGTIIKNDRLSFEDALHRQITHAYQFHYVEQVSHLASYDLLIDETWLDGERSKQRWSHTAAEYAVRETVNAAAYLTTQRRRLRRVFGHPIGLVLSAQGVEVEQYMQCAAQILPYMEEGDIFGLGGWCITGLLPSIMLPCFKQVMSELIPFLALHGIKRVHVWGVIMPEALAFLLALCAFYGIQPSTDSSGPCRYPILGNWGYGSWRNNAYKVPPILQTCKAVDVHGNKAPTCSPDTRCRGLERCRHVVLTRDYLAHFYEREPLLCSQMNTPLYVQHSLETEVMYAERDEAAATNHH